MARFKQFHDPELSIWQAAVGEVEAKAATGAQAQDVGAPGGQPSRPDDMDDMSSEATAYCTQVDTGTPITQATAVHPATEGLLQTAGFLLADGTQNRQGEDSGQRSRRAAI